MTSGVLYSGELDPIDISDVVLLESSYGPKGAMLAALPRLWTLPYALVPAYLVSSSAPHLGPKYLQDEVVIKKIGAIGSATGKLIVRSSVVGESIWDRGKYDSLVISATEGDLITNLRSATDQVIKSADGKQLALVIQAFIEPRARGEFGNLLRISKTRDQWEISAEEKNGTTVRKRFNSQRDEAASSRQPLEIKPGINRERLFGSVAAWINNYLMRGRALRVNCEWLTDNKKIYIVQVDEEDEDFLGVNPLQLTIPPSHQPADVNGSLLERAQGALIKEWDKLKVLDDLWEGDEPHKPILFSLPLEKVPQDIRSATGDKLKAEFAALVGPNGIVVRTSVRANAEKQYNLPRTECLEPEEAADWCIAQRNELERNGFDLASLSFVAHRFMAARASAWARVEPGNPNVEIHSLWGLPDALAYCPYDIWEVHVPTGRGTDYPEYKSNMLVPRDDGVWEYVRIKNEVARGLSVSRGDAVEIANRSLAIANSLGHSCHIMWFVGCVDSTGARFNIPWYWSSAQEPQRNVDRANYRVVKIVDRETLNQLRSTDSSTHRLAIELMPIDVNLMRDNAFISEVAEVARNKGIPVILAGSTLGHAYYQLRRESCTVVARGEKEHSRIRNVTNFGKLIRDKIPQRIAARQESETTRRMPAEIVKGFLTSKLFEEALEVKEAKGLDQKTQELADLFEVFRTLVKTEGIDFADVVLASDAKKEKAGGFDQGIVLLQTGILGADGKPSKRAERSLTQVLARRVAADTYEIPFTFFGFAEKDQVRTLKFEDQNATIYVTLRSDRIELRLSCELEQFELPLDLSVERMSKGSGSPQRVRDKK